MSFVRDAALILAIATVGMFAGVFGLYSNAIMPGLRRTEDRTFVDANDNADVAVAVLTEDRHVGERYELTGPRLLTFEQAVGEITAVTGRKIRYVPVTREEFVSGLIGEAGVPTQVAEHLGEAVASFFDGRHSRLFDGVEGALGRKPRDFADYVRDVAATGVWNAE